MSVAAVIGAPAGRQKRVLPGFGLTMGLTLTYVGIIVLLPVIALVLKGAEIGPTRFWEIVTAPRTLAALRLTITAAAVSVSGLIAFVGLVTPHVVRLLVAVSLVFGDWAVDGAA